MAAVRVPPHLLLLANAVIGKVEAIHQPANVRTDPAPDERAETTVTIANHSNRRTMSDPTVPPCVTFTLFVVTTTMRAARTTWADGANRRSQVRRAELDDRLDLVFRE